MQILVAQSVVGFESGLINKLQQSSAHQSQKSNCCCRARPSSFLLSSLEKVCPDSDTITKSTRSWQCSGMCLSTQSRPQAAYQILRLEALLQSPIA